MIGEGSEKSIVTLKRFSPPRSHLGASGKSDNRVLGKEKRNSPPFPFRFSPGEGEEKERNAGTGKKGEKGGLLVRLDLSGGKRRKSLSPDGKRGGFFLVSHGRRERPIQKKRGLPLRGGKGEICPQGRDSLFNQLEKGKNCNSWKKKSILPSIADRGSRIRGGRGGGGDMSKPLFCLARRRRKEGEKRERFLRI